MINLSNYSCDKCAREFSRHCKHCYHTAEKPPTKFKPKKKTGVQTPEFRKPTPPPPPPTSGSNAVKPNPNYVPPASMAKAHPIVCAMNLEDLDDWVKTRAQIGDVAYCHDRISDHHYIYRYLKPDDNPVWSLMNTDFLEKYSKKENKGDDKMNINGICSYETPCGWCAKWDKKCNKKIGCGANINIQKKKNPSLEYIKSGKGLPPLS